LQTQIGLSKFEDLGLKISIYISNYKGGRNKCKNWRLIGQEKKKRI